MSRKTSQIPTEEQMLERRSRYGRHLPVHPLRSSRVPSVLADRPEFVALQGERDAVREAEARLDREHFELTARNERARAEHQAAQREAMLTGAPPPQPLHLEPWLYPEFPRQMFDDFHAVIEATELGMLDEHADRWADELRTKVAPLRRRVEETRQTLQALEADAVPYEQALDALIQHQRVEARVVAPPRRPWDDQEAARAVREIQEAFEESRRAPRSRLKGRR